MSRGTALGKPFFIWLAQHANNGPKNICQMHAQLIREKQRVKKKKMLENVTSAALEAHVKVDASLKIEIIDVSVSYDGSKKSRIRKTCKTSDAMDTDANPSDSDYDIGLASEEDESLLEADFKKSGR
ncbi:hypothetical protein TNCV_4126541 [Trichonephila clavipes]|nr:hypothetical protein TNCV_4126541 [Trichonephila clavipes]